MHDGSRKRIASIALMPCHMPYIREVAVVTELKQTPPQTRIDHSVSAACMFGNVTVDGEGS